MVAYLSYVISIRNIEEYSELLVLRGKPLISNTENHVVYSCDHEYHELRMCMTKNVVKVVQ